MKRFLPLLLALLLTTCTARSLVTPTPVRLRIAGSTSLQPALADLARVYQTSHPYVLIEVQGGGSTVGLDALKTGKSDLAAVSWHAEGEMLPPDMQAIPIARDAIVVIVHPNNPIPVVTLAQLRTLYRGELLDWAALGAPAGETIIVSREEGSGTRAAFEALVMDGDRPTLNALVMPTSAAVVDYVAKHKTAIGYVSLSAVDDRVRSIPVEDIAPSLATLRSGEYPLTRILYLYAPRPASAELQAFLDFVLSPPGEAVVAKYHPPLR